MHLVVRSPGAPSTRAGLIGATCAIVLLTGAMPAYAGLDSFSLFRSDKNQQTGASTVVPSPAGTNFFFASGAIVDNASDFDVDGLTLTAPTGATHVMSGPGGASPFIGYDFESNSVSKADMDASFPAGKYTLDASNTGTGGHVTVSMNYDGTDHYSAAPQLTPTAFDALSSANPSASLSLQWDQFVPDAAINTPLIFFDIYDAVTGADVFSDSFLNDTTTGVTVPAGTLLGNHDYEEELIFSSRIDTDTVTDCTTNGPSCPGLLELGWDSRTFVDFTTAAAVPEPTTLALLGAGLLGVGAAARRRRSA